MHTQLVLFFMPFCWLSPSKPHESFMGLAHS